jgi:hypothetical protein
MNKQTVGIAGTYLVAAELSRMGYIALVTTRNTKDTDILVSNPNTGKMASIQVKTSEGLYKTKGKNGKYYWMLTKKDEDRKRRGLFYVFVVLTEPPIYFVDSSAGAARRIAKEELKRIKTGHKPTNMRYWIAANTARNGKRFDLALSPPDKLPEHLEGGVKASSKPH